MSESKLLPVSQGKVAQTNLEGFIAQLFCRFLGGFQKIGFAIHALSDTCFRDCLFPWNKLLVMVRRGACAEGFCDRSNRMFSLRKHFPWEVMWSWELIFSHSLAQASGKWDRHMSQNPPGGSSWEQPPWCAHFPDYRSSEFGCECWYCWLGPQYHEGCATRHRALLAVCACTTYPSFFA